MSHEIAQQLARVEAKLDTLLHNVQATPDEQKYLSARDVGRMVGLNSRTILNRSNLDPSDRRYVPSLSFGTKRKFFERRVVERLFRVT